MPGKRAVARQSLPELIANDLRERILSGELPEGAAIRQEALAEDYDVSRMPVREALKRLSAEGLIHWANNRGGSVARHSLREIGEIFDLRLLMEVDLFRRAIPNMTGDDFDACAAILEEMELSWQADDVGRWGKLNHAYHSALYAAADRGLTAKLLDRINTQADRYVRIHLSVMHQREPAREDHRSLLAHARARDVEAGCALLVRHIERTKAELLEMVAARRGTEDT